MPVMQETQVQFLDLEDPLEKENGHPLQYSRLENPMDRGTWQDTTYQLNQDSYMDVRNIYMCIKCKRDGR